MINKGLGGPIAWMARNRVASNLMMLILIIGGLLMASRVKQEIFPEFQLDMIRVAVAYPGASPEEVESGVILSIEDEVRSLDGVKEVSSTAYEGQGLVTIEVLSGVNASKILQDVKNVVDSIQSFPEEAERPIVSLLEPRMGVISLIIHGNVPMESLRDVAEKVRDDLIQLEGITLVELSGIPPLEMSIEVPQETLRSYQLTLPKIAQIVKQNALDLPGGGVRSLGGEVLLRTKERRDLPSEFADIPIVVKEDGTYLTLGEIAHVREIFAETDEEATFNGERSVRVNVFRVGKQGPLGISKIVREYVNTLRHELPENIGVVEWDDASQVLRERMGLLLGNAFMGLLLVLLFLGLFLEPTLAFWVTLGIPTSIIGAFLFIPWFGASINMVSLFAFIVTLGIIVDDAILVGEHIFHKREKGMPYLEAAIEGAKEMAGPVTFAVLTNIAAFIPLFFVPGVTGKIFLQIPAVVVAVFIVSLIESLFILPSHLSHMHKRGKIWHFLNIPSQFFEKWLKRFIDKIFIPQLKYAMHYRYFTLTCAICTMAAVFGLFVGGHIKFSYLPRVDSDIVTAEAQLPFGAPIEDARRVELQLVNAAKKVVASQGDIAKGIYAQVGKPLLSGGPPTPKGSMRGSHILGVQVALVPSDQRKISGLEFAKRWREVAGEPIGIETLTFSGMIHTGGGPTIKIQVSHPNTEVSELAAIELTEQLAQFKGVKDLDNGVALGKPQLSFKLKPIARGLNLTTRDLAEQVRGAFYGAEAFRQQRGRNEVKVMIRLPEEERKHLSTLDQLIIHTPSGGEIPLIEAADVTSERAYTHITHADGRRVITVTGDVDEAVANANQILGEVQRNVLPELQEDYAGLRFSFEGEQKEQQESLEALGIGFIFALFAIYALLAVPFNSYMQPLIVMLSIPFGVIGAILGHMLLGYELSIVSMFGIVALAGVVVNDSLVLIVTINKTVEEGKMSVFDAVVDAGHRRFRPIMLTSLTTFFGLCPMIFETSMQARFLIPMAISLGFGILFSTFIIMLITTAFYLILDDFLQWKKSRFYGP